MRIVLQRVSGAHVEIDSTIHASIGPGFVVLVGIEAADTQEDVDWITRKIVGMRVFSDRDGKMNLAINDIKADLLVISQFTLHASTRKGNRPSFIMAARPDQAIPLYEALIQSLDKNIKGTVGSGIFGATMQVSLVNDGPVTIIMDSKQRE